jgi:CheY-like chemotaxis protein
MVNSHTSAAQIVVIEDNPADVHLLRIALDETGAPYVLTILKDGDEALKFIEQQRNLAKPTPCAIVLDLNLPKYDGITVLRAIRKAPALANIKIAVISTLASPAELSHIQELGIDLYRQKPRDLEDFFALAADIIGLCEPERVYTAA